MNSTHNDITRMTYSINDIKHILGIGRDAAYKIVNRKGFPCIRNGNRIVIPKKGFHEWLDRQAN